MQVPESEEAQVDQLKFVCNNEVGLEENGAVGKPIHLPVTWLGSASEELALDDESYVRIRKQSMGWKQGPKVMVIVPFPMPEDLDAHCALSPSSTSGGFVRTELEKAGIMLSDVMVTHAARFVLPVEMKSYKPQNYAANARFVVEDVEQCKPEVIIAFGAPAVRSILGQKVKLDTVRGDVLEYTFRDGSTCKVVPTCSPLTFTTSHADIDQFRIEMQRAGSIYKGTYVAPERKTDYRVLTTADQVIALCKELEADPPKRIAFDTEFGNDVAREEFSYTLSLQMAWKKGSAAFIQFRHQEPQEPYTVEIPVGKPRKDGTQKTKTKLITPGPKCGVRTMSVEDENRCWAALQLLFMNPKIQLCGQHLRVDVNQFYKAGFPIDFRVADGFDTMLVHYLLYGDDMHGLDNLVRRYVPGFGAYWRELEEWLAENKKNVRLQFGYRDIPLDILIPYGLKDADATWQVAEILEVELDKHPKLKHLYWNLTAWTSLHLLDVERHGLLIDEERRMELREIYKPVYEDLLADLRKEINWPEFSPGSKVHVAYFLFNQYDYKDKAKGKLEAPDGCKLLSLRPLYNTDKYPKPWDDVIADCEESFSTPSTEVDVMDILSQTYKDEKALTLLKHLSVLSKYLSTYLSPIELNAFGVPEDGKGFHNNVRSDGRVVTKLSQLTATGRYTSQKANLQVQPKKQESAMMEALVYHKYGGKLSLEDYEKRTFDGNKKKKAYDGPDRIEKEDRIHNYKFKTCIIAQEGYTLIEADFKNAEVFVWAFASGDPALIKVVTMGRDLHSEVACSTFNLPPLADMAAAIAALEAGNKKVYDDWNDNVKKNYEALRTAAKAVNFGKQDLTSEIYTLSIAA